MQALIKLDLSKEFLNLKKSSRKHPSKGNRFKALYPNKQNVLEQALTVSSLLKKHPYLNARQVAEQTGLLKHQLALIYKMIQRSEICQRYFKSSPNRDYFNVVNHYFNNRLYVIVFFVGTNCTNRCVFCPNVRIDKLGRRRLTTYEGARQHLLSESQIKGIFKDIAAIKARGTNILIKISGGLEPLTDIRTMNTIITLAKKLSIPVKLFTNGLLLSDPEKRKSVLKLSDVRISLITPDEEQYQKICSPVDLKKRKMSGVPQLKENIKNLIRERAIAKSPCKIGFNSIVLPENHNRLIALMQLAVSLGVDYIDFKPDYFSSYDAKSLAIMDESIQEAKLAAQYDPYKKIYVNFTTSLSRKDLFWNSWQGTCDPQKQAEFKMFITPFGHLSPVHYGSFPHLKSTFQGMSNVYSIGRVTDRTGLLDIMKHPAKTPQIELKKLNPFELMLYLEITREEADNAWGLPVGVSPYHTYLKEVDVPFNLLIPDQEVRVL